MASLIGALFQLLIDVYWFLAIVSLRNIYVNYILSINFYYSYIAVDQHASVYLLRIMQLVEEIGDDLVRIHHAGNHKSFGDRLLLVFVNA